MLQKIYAPSYTCPSQANEVYKKTAYWYFISEKWSDFPNLLIGASFLELSTFSPQIWSPTGCHIIEEYHPLQVEKQADILMITIFFEYQEKKITQCCVFKESKSHMSCHSFSEKNKRHMIDIPNLLSSKEENLATIIRSSCLLHYQTFFEKLWES